MGARLQLGGTETDVLTGLTPVIEALRKEGAAAEREGHSALGWFRARQRWVAGSQDAGPRIGTVLWAPTAEEVQRVESRWPQARIICADPVSSRPLSTDERSLTILPRIVPDVFYPPGVGADVFGVTRRFHLESRPRLVYLGGYGNGPVLTRLLEVARRVLSLDGELVLVNSLAIRASFAPVVKRLGLAEQAVFLPELDSSDLAGVFLGADLIVAPDAQSTPRWVASCAMASGTPIVAQYSPVNEALLGPAALWVYQEEMEVWVKAVNKALLDEAIREELSRRSLEASAAWRQSEVLAAWVSALHPSEP